MINQEIAGEDFSEVTVTHEFLKNSGQLRAAERLFDRAASRCFNCPSILADRSQTLKDVTNKTSALSSRPHAPLTRMLALLLFVFVAYGATVEVVHRHGGNLAESADGKSSSITKTSSEEQATQESRQSGACLICQLHQNLFVSLFNAGPRLLPPTALNARTTTQPTSYLSQMDAPRRGRAPPLASLL